MADSTKIVISIQSWALENLSVEVSHYFFAKATIKIRSGLVLVLKDIFPEASSTSPAPSDISTPIGRNSIEFPN